MSGATAAAAVVPTAYSDVATTAAAATVGADDSIVGISTEQARSKNECIVHLQNFKCSRMEKNKICDLEKCLDWRKNFKCLHVKKI